MRITEWIADLRSGRWKQGYGALYDGECFCVMGTLADALGVRWIRNPHGEYCYEYTADLEDGREFWHCCELIDYDTSRATGFASIATDEILQYVEENVHGWERSDVRYSIEEIFTVLNDSYKIPFNELADLAEWLYNKGYIYDVRKPA